MPYPIFWLLITILQIYMVVVLIWVILSWLVAFNVVNRYNPFVQAIMRATSVLVEPALAPIRRILPPLGGFDFSPIVLWLIIMFVLQTLQWLQVRYGF